ncbi:transcription initiation factor TFIID subunit 8 [Tanacetum coccineum]
MKTENKQKRLLRADELYKFSESTLKSVRNEIHYRVHAFRLDYNTEMPKRKIRYCFRVPRQKRWDLPEGTYPLVSVSSYRNQSDTKVLTMTMEILPEPTSNKLCGRFTLTVLSALRRSDFLTVAVGDSEKCRCLVGLVRSGVVKEVMGYVMAVENVDMDVDVQFVQPVVGFLVLRDKKVRQAPSFMQMGKMPEFKHVPEWLPPFPDPHTYVHTPAWKALSSVWLIFLLCESIVKQGIIHLCGKLLLLLDADGSTKVDDLAKLENQVGVTSAVYMGYVLSEVPNGRHYLQCSQGLLGNHFEKLIKCDPRLNFLSQQAEVKLESPYFEPMTSVFDEPNETNEYDLSWEVRPGIFDLHRTSPYSSSRSELHDLMVD